MKITELRPCDSCRKPVGITFLRVHAEHMLVDIGKVRRHAAMGMFFGGSRALADVFTDDECTKVAKALDLVLCWECAVSCGPICVAMEKPEEDGKP